MRDFIRHGGPASVPAARSGRTEDPRRTALTQLALALDANQVTLVRCASTLEGARIASIETTPADAATELVDAPFAALVPDEGWSLERPPHGCIDAFGWAPTRATEPRQRVRAAIYHERTLVCYVTADVAREAQGIRSLRALDGHIRAIRQACLDADAVERARLRAAAPINATIDADGTMASLSSGARTWLEPGCIERIRALVRAMVREERDAVTHLHGVAELQLTRLEGPSGVIIAANVRETTPVVLAADHDLSDRQREVAAFASAGATVAEIAETLDISPNTVKTHLKEVYRTLAVASRVELREALEASAP